MVQDQTFQEIRQDRIKNTGSIRRREEGGYLLITIPYEEYEYIIVQKKDSFVYGSCYDSVVCYSCICGKYC